MSIETLSNLLDVPNTSCSYAMKLPREERCDFVLENEDCAFEDTSILKSYKWVFCSSGKSGEILGIIAAIFILVWLFLIMSTIADAYVCPCVVVLAKTLRMSDNIAGVTIIALGNGCPDFFTALAGAELGHSEILFGATSGSTLLVTTLVTGIIMWARPFRVSAWPLMFNSGFLFVAYSILFSGFYFRNFNYYHSTAILIVYIVYIIVTVLESKVSSMFEKSQNIYHFQDDYVKGTSVSETRGYHKYSTSYGLLVQLENKSLHIKDADEVHEDIENDWKKVKPLFKDFLSEMRIVKCAHWLESNCFEKFMLIVQGINEFWLKIILPTVNPDLPFDGWCKLLRMINMVLLPSFLLFSVESLFVDINGVPIWPFALFIGATGSIIIFFTTSTHVAPKYHYVFAILGFLGSMLMTNIIANEVIIILQTIGTRFSIRSDLSSMTLLALGNSITDLFVNYGLAKSGYQNMAIAACFAAPIFTCSFQVGVISLIIFIKTGMNIDAFYGSLGPASGLYFYICHISIFFVLVLMNFKARRSFGLYLIVTYFVFIVLIILMGTVIHPFGTQIFKKKRIDGG